MYIHRSIFLWKKYRADSETKFTNLAASRYNNHPLLRSTSGNDIDRVMEKEDLGFTIFDFVTSEILLWHLTFDSTRIILCNDLKKKKDKM